jgi:DNA-binding Lrp family transcriptional regulator
MTHATGVAECLTSMPKLAAAAGVSERQTYNVVKELERNGFIERPETFNTPTKKGTVFRLLLSRRTTPSPERRYHFGD